LIGKTERATFHSLLQSIPIQGDTIGLLFLKQLGYFFNIWAVFFNSWAIFQQFWPFFNSWAIFFNIGSTFEDSLAMIVGKFKVAQKCQQYFGLLFT
jgi:hypothetical protein